jgi:hypothetical protein
MVQCPAWSWLATSILPPVRNDGKPILTWFICLVFAFVASCKTKNSSPTPVTSVSDMIPHPHAEKIVLNPHIRNIVSDAAGGFRIANWSGSTFLLRDGRLKAQPHSIQGKALDIRDLAVRDSTSYWLLHSTPEASQVYGWNSVLDEYEAIPLPETATKIASGVDRDHFFYKASDLTLHFWSKQHGSEKLLEDCALFCVSADGKTIAVRRASDHAVLISTPENRDWKKILVPLNGELMGFDDLNRLWILEIMPQSDADADSKSTIFILEHDGKKQLYLETNYWGAWLASGYLIGTTVDYEVVVTPLASKPQD